ncbi:MAG TPA: family 1 encapsulin nanocompartment shell protein [Blastocatellia bacterium]|nr:family 1 encapsulin nanocompartment shell protein [Blastocatellia bacterium]
MPIFAHEENPLNDQEWENIKSVVINVARRRLIGRRIVDLHGPLGPGVQTIVHDHFAGTTMGRIGLLGEEESDPVRSVRRESGIIPIIYKDFILHWRDIETARQTGAPLDVAAAAAAAAFCADTEDNLIFNGNPEMGYEGMMVVEGRQVITRRDWTEAGNPFQDVVDATQTLVERGFYGPYAMVVSPRLYTQMHQVHPGTGTLEIEQIRQLVTDGVYQSPLIRDGFGLIVSTGTANFDLAVAQDLTVAYLGAEHMNHPFRVFESVYLRIKRHGSICTLEPGTAETRPSRKRG